MTPENFRDEESGGIKTKALKDLFIYYIKALFINAYY